MLPEQPMLTGVLWTSYICAHCEDIHVNLLSPLDMAGMGVSASLAVMKSFQIGLAAQDTRVYGVAISTADLERIFAFEITLDEPENMSLANPPTTQVYMAELEPLIAAQCKRYGLNNTDPVELIKAVKSRGLPITDRRYPVDPPETQQMLLDFAQAMAQAPAYRKDGPTPTEPQPVPDERAKEEISALNALWERS